MPTLPASAGSEVVRTSVGQQNCSNETTGCEALSLPNMFFDYSDLDALKTSLPSLHIWRDDQRSEAAASRGQDATEVCSSVLYFSLML